MVRKGLKIGAALAGVIGALVCTVCVQAEAPMKSLVVEEGTTRIEKYQYFSQWALEEVLLPNSLEEIGFSAFDNCTSLEEIKLPAGLRVIENRGFAKCESLLRITFPETVNTIGNAAFYGCSSLEEITLPDMITTVENNLFYKCSSLKNVKMSNNITTIGQQSFFGCTSLTELELPDNLQRIEDGAFYECSNLKMLRIPDSVNYIGEDAFYGCVNLVLECTPDSYAEQYAKSHELNYNLGGEQNVLPKQDEISVASMPCEIESNGKEQVPETGVELPYVTCLVMMCLAMTTLFMLKKSEKSKSTFKRV